MTEILELRQYHLHPGAREHLIELFDREFIESQEAVGMSVLGQFRDPDRPDHFVWLRSFADMATRHDALTSFYGGPVWAAHRDAANATMIDSENVHLLRPLSANDALPAHDPTRRGRHDPTGSVFVLTAAIDELDLDIVRAGDFVVDLIPLLEACGVRTIGLYATEESPNTFTRLPVRRDRVVMWIGAAPDESGATWHALQRAIASRASVTTHTELLHLRPTSRSVLDGTA